MIYCEKSYQVSQQSQILATQGLEWREDLQVRAMTGPWGGSCNSQAWLEFPEIPCTEHLLFSASHSFAHFLLPSAVANSFPGYCLTGSCFTCINFHFYPEASKIAWGGTSVWTYLAFKELHTGSVKKLTPHGTALARTGANELKCSPLPSFNGQL